MAALSEAGALEVGATSGGGCRSVDGAAVAGLSVLLKLGRPREGRTLEVAEKTEDEGAALLWWTALLRRCC